MEYHFSNTKLYFKEDKWGNRTIKGDKNSNQQGVEKAKIVIEMMSKKKEMTKAKTLHIDEILKYILHACILKAYYFLGEKRPSTSRKKRRKREFKNCMLQAHRNLLSASIRHGIYFKPYSATYSI